MTDGANTSSLCARVFDRLVEAGEVAGDPELERHLGTCMTCFRTLTELRDAPRLAALMREGASSERRSERFWADAADRTTDAVATALRVAAPPRRRVWARAVAATALVAAAAVFVVVAGRLDAVAPRGTTSPAASGIAESARLAGEDDFGDDEDVVDLDTTTLRRLVDRLRAGAPSELATLAAIDSSDGAEMLFDDDARVSDELADLDQAALVRIERSLAGSAL